LAQVLGAGIPAALWPRSGSQNVPDATEVEEKIAALIAAENLKDLPRIVRRERLDAREAPDLGNYLTLLWDDPDKVPPRQRLQSR
jgi:hypothetical protein